MAKASKKLPKVINAYKDIGETPLEVIQLLKESSEALNEVPITYAGRLDPMAEGVLLLLVGDEVHEKEEYLNLEKEYEFKILFGFSTDTNDLLGRIDNTEDVVFKTAVFEKTLPSFVGKYEQEYPPYSSKTVDGVPLFQYARDNRMHEIEIPKHEVEIKSLEPLKIETISSVDLKEYLRENIAKVKGDFRQKETLELWNAYIDNSMKENFDIASLRVVCGSGMYVRVLARDIGRALKIPTTVFSILRTRVGDYKIETT